MVPGVLVPVLSGETDNPRVLLVPALTLRQLEMHHEELQAVRELLGAGNWTDLTIAQLRKVTSVLMLTIGRNHPGVTSEDLFDLLDINTASTALAALFGLGKFIVPETPPAPGLLNIDPTTSLPCHLPPPT